MSKLRTLQNKAIKFICTGKKSDHVIHYYFKLNDIKTSRFIQHKAAKIVFRFSRDNLSLTLQHLFSKTSEISSCNTRSSTNIYNLCIPQYTTTRLPKKKVLRIKEKNL